MLCSCLVQNQTVETGFIESYILTYIPVIKFQSAFAFCNRTIFEHFFGECCLFAFDICRWLCLGF